MDAVLFAAAGIPTVNYGPSGAGAHEAVEWVDLDSVVSSAQVLAETARRFCRGSFRRLLANWSKDSNCSRFIPLAAATCRFSPRAAHRHK